RELEPYCVLERPDQHPLRAQCDCRKPDNHLLSPTLPSIPTDECCRKSGRLAAESRPNTNTSAVAWHRCRSHRSLACSSAAWTRPTRLLPRESPRPEVERLIAGQYVPLHTRRPV